MVSIFARLLCCQVGMDDPAHAAAALAAARALSKIAPDAGHAQHMCFVSGFAAAKHGDLAAAHTQLKSVTDSLDRMRAEAKTDSEDVKAMAVAMTELTGLIHAQEHDFDSAIAELKQASEAYEKMAFAFGPPVTVKPPEELLGEILLQNGDAADARAAFEQSLKLAPRRTQSLLGRARAQFAAGDKGAAKSTYSELVAIWHSADADAPGLAEAKAASR